MTSETDNYKRKIHNLEVSKKECARVLGITIQTVNTKIRNNELKWRYLFPETKELIVIDITNELPKSVTYTPLDNYGQKVTVESTDLVAVEV